MKLSCEVTGLTYTVLFQSSCFDEHRVVPEFMVWRTPCCSRFHGLTYTVLFQSSCFDEHHVLPEFMVWRTPCCSRVRGLTYTVLFQSSWFDVHRVVPEFMFWRTPCCSRVHVLMYTVLFQSSILILTASMKGRLPSGCKSFPSVVLRLRKSKIIRNAKYKARF